MKKEYLLSDKTHKKIILVSNAFLRNLKIYADEELVGEFKSARELKEGKEFTLANGSILKIYFMRTWGQVGFDIYYDWAAVKGSFSSSESQYQQAFALVFFLAIMNLGLGLVQGYFSFNALKQYSALGILIMGLFYLSLSYFIKNGNRLTLIVATATFVMDFLMTIWMVGKGEFALSPAGFAVKILFSYKLISYCIYTSPSLKKN